MKIQEMRSSILHLSRKTEPKVKNNVFDLRVIGDPALDEVLPGELESELEKPIWSVVSFDQQQAGGLTYKQAIVLLSELDAYDISGLCIVTDEAALRISQLSAAPRKTGS